MNKKIQRIGLIVLMAGAVAYTFYNYTRGNTDKTTLFVLIAFMGFLLIGQITALIREWNED